MSDRPASGAPAFEQPNFGTDDDAGDERELDSGEDVIEDEELEDDELEDDEDLEEDEEDEDDLEDEDEDEDLEDEDEEEDLEDEEEEEEDLEDEDAGLGMPSGNRRQGGTALGVLEHIARSVVDDPDAVLVDVTPARSGVKLSLHVAPSDMGRIIGRRGRVAQALRTVVRAAAAKDGSDAVVDIVD